MAKCHACVMSLIEGAFSRTDEPILGRSDADWPLGKYRLGSGDEKETLGFEVEPLALRRLLEWAE